MNSRGASGWWIALVAFLYFATSPYHAGLHNPNELVRVYLTKALVDHGTFAIDPVIATFGGVDDKAIRDGKLYSSKAPLQSLLGVPAYWLYRALGGAQNDLRAITTALRLFGAVLPSLLFSIAFGLWIERRARKAGLSRHFGAALALGLALGTMLYPYAITFTGHGLAAATAGGAFLAVLCALELREDDPKRRRWLRLAGFLAGAAPFAEYPAALTALPAVGLALWSTQRRAFTFGQLALGGALPFGLGLWAHAVCWGSPLRTGYSFLENRAYVEVHRVGFFGVSAPSPSALVGSLFDPGTGLFFYSPLLLLGLLSLLRHAFAPPGRAESETLSRPAARAALIAFSLELLFIASHSGWRGGWTVGPRYIIPVVVVLGLALPFQDGKLKRLLPPLAALSIATTGFAAALYPHLSDVFTNPLGTFLWPSYRAGYASYGLAHALGLGGHAANLVHLLPLGVAVVWAATAGDPPRAQQLGRGLFNLGLVALALLAIRSLPERNPDAARRENQRLWGFWEPARRRGAEAAALTRARDRFRTITVSASGPGGPRDCTPEASGTFCRYGREPWQRFGPEQIDLNGKKEALLFLHPIAGQVLTATVPWPDGAQRAELIYGLADASVESDNDAPVELRLEQGGRPIATAKATNVHGLHRLPLAAEPGRPLVMKVEVTRDGARVFGFDLLFFR